MKTILSYIVLLLAITSPVQAFVMSAMLGSVPQTTVYTPNAPTIGTATAGDTTASVAFTAGAVDGTHSAADSYTATSTVGGKTGTATGSPITVTGLTNGTGYAFTVTATNSAGTSAASAASNSVTPVSSTFPPNAPVSVSVIEEDSKNTLIWAAGAVDGSHSAATQYNILRSTSPGTETLYASNQISPYVNTGLTNGAPYFYKVQAQNIAGTANSTEVSGTPAAQPPNVPTAVASTAGDAQATVTWTNSAVDSTHSAATAYNIYRSTSSNAETLFASSQNSPYTNTGLTNGTTYYYKVQASNSAGNVLSAETSVTPTAAGAYPTVLANNASVTSATFPMTALVTSGGSLTQTAADTFTVSDTSSAAAGAALYNTSAWASTYDHKIKITNLPSLSGSAMWVPILSTTPAISDIITVLTNKKIRFGLVTDGSANQGKVYASYVNTGGTEYFLQTNGTWGTSLVFFTPTGGMQLRVQRDASNYTLTIYNADGTAITGASASIAISSVKNGSGGDYMMFGDIATDYLSSATIQVIQ